MKKISLLTATLVLLGSSLLKAQTGTLKKGIPVRTKYGANNGAPLPNSSSNAHPAPVAGTDLQQTQTAPQQSTPQAQDVARPGSVQLGRSPVHYQQGGQPATERSPADPVNVSTPSAPNPPVVDPHGHVTPPSAPLPPPIPTPSNQGISR